MKTKDYIERMREKLIQDAESLLNVLPAQALYEELIHWVDLETLNKFIEDMNGWELTKKDDARV